MVRLLKTAMLLTFLYSCSNDKGDSKGAQPHSDIPVSFQIVDVDTALDNNLVYSVYASGPNLSRLAEYADSLLRDKNDYSVVSFFNELENTPQLKWGAYDEKYIEYNIASYSLDERDGRFKLYYGDGKTLVLPNGKRGLKSKQ